MKCDDMEFTYENSNIMVTYTSLQHLTLFHNDGNTSFKVTHQKYTQTIMNSNPDQLVFPNHQLNMV